MGMPALVDMERDRDDMRAVNPASPPDRCYPYGLVINLDKVELQKLGITELPPMGTEYHLIATGCVTRLSHADDGQYEEMSMSVQIETLAMAAEAPEPGEASETASDEQAEFKTLLGSYI